MSALQQLPNTYRSFFGRFTSLTAVQKALIRPILEKRDVILQAGTGLGKTEAILAPATERLITYQGHFTILYIVPTRALALDMHRRIHVLYEPLGLKVGIRTGDGKTLKEAKPHLLILTPESLDVLLGSQHPENKYFLKHVQILILDEVHTFLGTARGSQLFYLRRRLAMQSKEGLQTLTLTATMADPDEISSFFRLNHPFYYGQSAARQMNPCWVHIKDERRELVSFFDDLFLRWKCKKLLVFANSRKKCEWLFDLLNHEGNFSQSAFLHYSNLSTQKRRFIESSFRSCKQGVCIATSTLEMGIDIGDIDGVVLIGPPPSTAAFLQRIGRGNRRQHFLKFWGVCYGSEAASQLLRFLALFEQTLQNKLETRPLVNSYSVVFQQILSCLYAKKTVSKKLLEALFQAPELTSIMDKMLAKYWLEPMREPKLFTGGSRYKIALQRHQIWSNFPPSDEEYEVILEKEVIATLSFSTIKQLKVGNIFQLVGKRLKLLQIEETKISRSMFVEESDLPITHELVWDSCGTSVSFELAQSMKTILLGECKPQGLLTRTQRLLDSAKRPYVQGENSLYAYRLQCGLYRYETFLGTIGNFILYHQIRQQLSDKIKGFIVRFDELGIESNEWISFKILKLPDSPSLFQKWVSSHLPLLKAAFSWNSWLYSLPEDLQEREIYSSLLDLRVLERFAIYKAKPMPSPPPLVVEIVSKEKLIPLKGKPRSFEDERQAWGQLSFPKIPEHVDLGLSASQLQSYVAQKTCPRLAHFQRVGFSITPHPRLQAAQRTSDFKKQVLKTLTNVRFETAQFTLNQAIDEVIASQIPLFLAQPKLKVDQPFSMRGSPDLIYLQPRGSRVRLEVWDIKDRNDFTYAQKWKLAFYVYLLERLLSRSVVDISECAGLVHRMGTEPQKTAFSLLHFMSWMPRLIAQWQTDSMKPFDQYSLSPSCASCRYFSYCYQETLFKSEPSKQEPAIVCVEPESIDLPPNSDDWPSIQSFLQKHFIWPVDGHLSATQVAKCLGLTTDLPSPPSLYHKEPCIPSDLCKQIWGWCTSHVKSVRSSPTSPTNLIDTYLFIQRQEWEEHTLTTLAFQKNPLSMRVEQFRSIGPLTFLSTHPKGRELHYLFSIDPKAPIAKFRVGDFLKLSPANSMQIQDGFSVILTSYLHEEKTLSLRFISEKRFLSKDQFYALDECATDWNAPKIETVFHRLKNPKFRPELVRMLHGHGKTSPLMAKEWAERWYQSQAERAHLNAMQEQAFLLPFSKNVGLIEGPPGTGKTHLLVWTLIALIAHAKSVHHPIKILVTALSHQAIDQILLKIAHTVSPIEKIPIWKYGGNYEFEEGVEVLQDAKPLTQNVSFILGATGFGVYQLLDGKQFPTVFDWIIFDEASQILPSQALLSLVFGKGNALFYGDTQQLPPILKTNLPARSILAELISRFPAPHRLRLNETYRMNGPICQFVSRHWYKKELHSAVADARLELLDYPRFGDRIDAYLDPSKPLTVVPITHEENLQSSKEEAFWIAEAVKRLILDYSFPVQEIGIISPHRLQNNTILNALKEILPPLTKYPKIDTVERMQGQEFDLVFFSATTSHQNQLHSAFLKDHHRFNVSISRARKKFLLVASHLFFQSFPRTEAELIAHVPFEDFFASSTAS